MRLRSEFDDVIAVLDANVATFLAGSLAYSAFMSLLPLLTLAVVAATLGDPVVLQSAIRLSETYLTPTGTALLVDELQNGTGRTFTSVFSVLLLFWSGLRVFRGLDTAFSLLYDTVGTEGILAQVRDALLVFGLFVAALVVSVGVGLAVAVWGVAPLDWLLGSALLVLPLVLVFLPIYYVFPDVDVTVREVLPGVTLAAVGWAVSHSLFQLYVDAAGRFELYGAIGGVLLLLTWLYLASLLLLVGGAVNVVLAGRTARALRDTRPDSDVPSSR